MNNVLILLDNPDDWKPYCETKSILTVSDYLKNKPVEKDRKLVINLSNDYSYNSEGYYCSLLAQTRGQRVIPVPVSSLLMMSTSGITRCPLVWASNEQ